MHGDMVELEGSKQKSLHPADPQGAHRNPAERAPSPPTTPHTPTPSQVVVKSQVLAGGRGLGRFTNGLQGGVHIADVATVVELSKQMLGGTLVTKQVRHPSCPPLTDSGQP